MHSDSSVPIPDLDRHRVSSLPLFCAYLTLTALLLAIATCALSALLIRSFDSILTAFAPLLGLQPETGTFRTQVLAQLGDATLHVHGVVPTILSFSFTFAVGFMVRAGRRTSRFGWVIAAAAVVGLALFLLSLSLSVWMTDVNDIRFGDILRMLMQILRAGSAGLCGSC